MNKINLSPSFLSKVYSKGYDYAVGEKLGLIDKPDTGAMNDGKLLHGLIAERLGYKPVKVAIPPYDNFRTKEAREWRDLQPYDTLIVNEQKLAKFNKIADRVVNHPTIKPMLENAKPELVIEKEVNGFNVKGILDVVSPYNGGTVIDWKFISSKNFDKFTKEALWSNYDLQASVYDYLTNANHVYFGVIESESPHRIKLFYCEQSFLEGGADKFNKAFKILEKENWREPNFDILEVGSLEDWGNM